MKAHKTPPHNIKCLWSQQWWEIVPYEPVWDDQENDFDLLQILSDLDENAQKAIANPQGQNNSTSAGLEWYSAVVDFK